MSDPLRWKTARALLPVEELPSNPKFAEGVARLAGTIRGSSRSIEQEATKLWHDWKKSRDQYRGMDRVKFESFFNRILDKALDLRNTADELHELQSEFKSTN